MCPAQRNGDVPGDEYVSPAGLIITFGLHVLKCCTVLHKYGQLL